MKKQLCALLLALCLTLGLAAPAGAVYDPDQDRYTTEDGDWVAMPSTDEAGEPCLDLWRYDGDGGDVTVPASIDGIPLSSYLVSPGEFNDLRGVKAITSYTVEPGGAGLFAEDGVLFGSPEIISWDGKTYNYHGDLLSYPKASTAKSYRVPEGTGVIAEWAFRGCRGLERVVVPAGTFYVEDGAFSGCTALKTVIFEGPTDGFNLGLHAFSNCTSLTSVVLPEGVDPSRDAFSGCTNLRTLLVPAGLSGFTDEDAFGLSPEEFPNLTVYGPAGCYMEAYCASKGVPFEAVDYAAMAAEIAAEQEQFNPEKTQGQAAPTGETPSPWAVSDVEGARAEGLLPAALDGKYTQPITRAEFASLACAFAARMGLRPGGGAASSFPDTSDPDVTRAAAMGVITGYTDGTFGPDQSIRRDEAAAMLARAARLAGQETDGPARTFTDAAAFGWAKGEIAFITACFLPGGASAVMNGTSAREFTPTGSYTREQAIATFYRLCAYCNRLPTLVLDAGEPLELLRSVEVRVDGNTLTATGSDAPGFRMHLNDADNNVILDTDPPAPFASLGAAGDPRLACALSATVLAGTGAPALDLSNVPDGKYTVWVQTNSANGYVDLQLVGDDAYFLPLPSYGQNLDLYQTLTTPSGDQYLNVSNYVDWNDPAVQAKARELTAGCTTDYEKARAIFRWVNANIEYDWYFYYNGTGGMGYEASAVLSSGTGVCSGISYLAIALLRASGIPARAVTGYSLGYSSNGTWDMANLRDTNHQWVMAWLDGRWVFIDPTWGQFDRTLIQQSQDHAADAAQRSADD